MIMQIVRRVSHFPSVRRGAERIAGARGRGLVLVYHEIAQVPREDPATPTISVAEFEQQVGWLSHVGDIVPLPNVLDGGRDSRPRFAITFDDDYESHAKYALPVLERHGVPATFFLSGRWLHGLGRYWWEKLDTAIALSGLESVAQTLGVDAATPTQLAARLEVSQDLQGMLDQVPLPDLPPLSDRWFQMLLGADMGIGFHTVDHPRLTAVGDHELDEALQSGRADLAEAAGRHLSLFAYPHGRAGAREADAVDRAGFEAAFTTSKDPVGAGTDRYLVGRWEPDTASLEDFAAETAWRLNAPIRPGRN
ncbi:MAG: polysaccharide deacetylase family protein [Acidimicrobiia bacterium]|nr:polysaccharide deacetylase family protein [Acidimicrobiia bacterium]